MRAKREWWSWLDRSQVRRRNNTITCSPHDLIDVQSRAVFDMQLSLTFFIRVWLQTQGTPRDRGGAWSYQTEVRHTLVCSLAIVLSSSCLSLHTPLSLHVTLLTLSPHCLLSFFSLYIKISSLSLSLFLNTISLILISWSSSPSILGKGLPVNT